MWTLREYHLQEQEGRHDAVKPLPFGDPLLGFFPAGCRITEKIESRSLICREPGKTSDVTYARWHPTSVTNNGIDILIVGGGHGNWGQFNLRGRVRKSDGLVTLVKEYTDGPRGRWLYRGFVVGHPAGTLAGRWRDTITPIETDGYEGCFGMTRRQ